jgi:hypothetical protein
MDSKMDRAVPGWFWAVAVLAVLWEAFGCYIYVSQSLVPDGQREGDYAAMANWQWGVFATAVWSGLVGAVLLVLRSRWATALLLLSFLTAAFQYGYAAAGTANGISAEALPIAVSVLVVGLLLVIYSSRAQRAGWLR